VSHPQRATDVIGWNGQKNAGPGREPNWGRRSEPSDAADCTTVRRATGIGHARTLPISNEARRARYDPVKRRARYQARRDAGLLPPHDPVKRRARYLAETAGRPPKRVGRPAGTASGSLPAGPLAARMWLPDGPLLPGRPLTGADVIAALRAEMWPPVA
jgi:hypothetical protein